MGHGLAGKPAGSAGFTLIELMIALAIVAILAAIAFPSYQEQVRKSRRADAQAVLLEAAQFLERNYTESGSYSLDSAGAALTLLPVGLRQSPKDAGTKYYNLTFVSATNTYTLTAAPIAASPQNGDRCGNLTLTNTGVKGASATDCWRR